MSLSVLGLALSIFFPSILGFDPLLFRLVSTLFKHLLLESLTQPLMQSKPFSFLISFSESNEEQILRLVSD